MKQGQSENTEEKSRGFSSVFRQQAAVVTASPYLKHSTYVHVDLHAGCGWNEEVDVIGSPLLFQEIARQHRMTYRMFCCEIDRARCKQLGERLKTDHHSFPHCGHNEEMCEIVPDLMRHHGIEPSDAVGSILVDPNGFVDQIPWNGLQKLMKVCGRLDVVFNFPGTAYTRNVGHSEYVHIDRLPELLNKKHWFVRKPLNVHKFTLCVGRNTDKLKIPSRDGLPFADWHSIEGRRYRLKAMTRESDLKNITLPGQMEFGWS